MNIRLALTGIIAILFFGLSLACTPGKTDDRPNILWIVVEDISCHFAYNGEQAVNTPNVDQLAADGMSFTNAYVTGPVCSPSRSAMITGMYQTSIGVHNHRSSSTPESAINLPENIELLPELFREAGYYTSNSKGTEWSKAGKTDYNFVFDTTGIYDGTDWSGRKEGQPFFAQVQLWGGKLTAKQIELQADSSKLMLPPYYPQDPVILSDWNRYLGSVMQTDYHLGQIMERLENEGLLENTIIFFITDHGISHIRDKQYLYEGGIKIPFIIRAPGHIENGIREELISHIDMAATSLYFAGIEIPEYMESRSLYGPDAQEREYVVSARDRCDETEDRIRSVRKGDFKYIRNFYPERPYLLPNAYKDNKAIMKRMRKLYAEGKLNADQSLIMQDTRPAEELYDLSNDPWELNNLAGDEAYGEKLEELGGILDNWIAETDDKGQYPEDWGDYMSNIKEANAAMLKRNTNPVSLSKEKERLKNAALMKQWREKDKANAQSALPLESYGVWDRDGAGFDPDDPNYDYLKGLGYTSHWSAIQADDSSSYNWEDMQKAIDWAAEKDLTIFIGVAGGPDSPDWIYENGVPKVYTKVTRKAHERWPYYPYYLDPDYKRHYFRFIEALGDFLQSQPESKRKCIGFIQVKSGCTGDECAYKGTIEDPQYEKYRLDKKSDEWLDYRLEVFDLHKKVFVEREQPIALLFNCADEKQWPREWKWVSENVRKGFGVKGLAYIRGHHLTYETSFVHTWWPYLIDPEGLALFSRAEMDHSWEWPLFQLNLELGFYWGAISGLNQGISVWDIFKGALKEAGNNPSIQETFRFFNKYAGQIYPKSSTRAFIALHEGLDASDTEKFPEEKYGKASFKNTDRYQAICDDPVYAARGARMDDLPYAAQLQHKQRQEQTGYNDAGWDIWPGNYSRFISQLDPNKESVGLFRVGGTIDKDSPIYSRFARSFEHKSGRDAMYFKLHSDFFTHPAGSVYITVTYYDNIKGSKWELKYDAGEGNFKRAVRIKGKGSKTWKTEKIYLEDAVMQHNGPGGCDFALVNTDAKDDIFHLIEIEK